MKRHATLLSLAFVSAIFLFYSAPTSRTHAAPPPESAPISLTNPDGQSLTLEKYDLRAAVHGPLALVEMEMIFRNPQARQMEGRFVYTLPAGATISRFAKEVNGKLMEGEVVERMRAQAVFTEILHTMRDPALLETDQGNRFSARIFPVPASGTVRLLLAFSQTLPLKEGVRKLTIPLAGLPKIGEFKFSAIGRPLDSETGSGTVLDKDETFGEQLTGFSRHATDFEPKKDIELVFKQTGAAPVRALRAGNFQMVQFRYDVPIETRRPIPETDWSFFIDTSASGADIEAPRRQALGRLIYSVDYVLSQKTFSAYAFDIDVVEIIKDFKHIPPAPSGVQVTAPPSLSVRATHDFLNSRHALGATNLEAALKAIGEQARAAQNPRTFVLASDGIPTWGAREPAALVAALGTWPAQHTLHALVIGSRQDERILKAITEKTRGRIVALPLGGDLEKNVEHAFNDLREPLGAHFEVYDEGTAWIYPKEFHDVRPGTELIAFSEIKDGAKSKPGFAQRGANGKLINDTAAEATPLEAADFAPLLRREAYKAYLEALDKDEQAATDATKRAEIHHKRVETSVKNRVLCPLTSLLVLESENDYRRFNIDRNALADIMQIGMAGIELRKRSADEVPLPIPVRETRKMAMKDLQSGGGGGGGKTDEKAAKLEKSVAEAVDSLDDFAKRDGMALSRERGTALSDDAVRGETLLRSFNGDLDTVTAATDGRDAAGRRADFPGPSFNVQAQGGGPGQTPPLPASTPTEERAIRLLPEPLAPRTPPVANPEPAQREAQIGQIRTTGNSTNLGMQRKQPAEWSQQDKLTDDQLNTLRAQVQANPTDRRARNAYADALFKAQKWDNLQAEVFQWLPFDPENPAVYEYLGKSAAGLNDPALALRAYSSIAEIAPNRAALLARAGWLLLATKKCDLAEAMFAEALKNRQDDANIHRGLALSRWLGGKFDESAAAYEAALMREYNQRYGDVKRVLREEYAYVLRAWRKKDAAKADAILARAQNAGLDLFRTDALRVTMAWETDANDVDLHVVDPNGEECFYSHKNNASGLELYSDQTQGLGPEVIRTQKTLPGTYHIGVNYFSAGPMGVSRGVVLIMKPIDGVDENPEIIPFALIEGGKDLRLLGAASF